MTDQRGEVAMLNRNYEPLSKSINFEDSLNKKNQIFASSTNVASLIKPEQRKNLIADAHHLLDRKNVQNSSKRKIEDEGTSLFLPEPRENYPYVSYPYALQKESPLINKQRQLNKKTQENIAGKIGSQIYTDKEQPAFKKDRHLEEADYTWNWDNNRRGRMLKEEYRKQAKHTVFQNSKSRSPENSFEKIGERTDRSTQKDQNNVNLLIKPPSAEKIHKKLQNHKNDLLDQIRYNEEQRKRSHQLQQIQDKKLLDDQMLSSPFGRPGAGAPNHNYISAARMNRDAHLTGFYNEPPTNNNGNNVFAAAGNNIIEGNTYQSPTQEDFNSYRRPDRFNQNYQVPGLGSIYTQRDQHFLDKKQRIANDLSAAYQQQIEEKRRRTQDEIRRRYEEERLQEEKIRKQQSELQQMRDIELHKKKAEIQMIQQNYDAIRESNDREEQERRARMRHINQETALMPREQSKEESKTQVKDEPRVQLERKDISNEKLQESIPEVKLEKSYENKEVVNMDEYKIANVSEELQEVLKENVSKQLRQIKNQMNEHSVFMRDQLLALKSETITAEENRLHAIQELKQLQDELMERKEFIDLRNRDIYQHLTKKSLDQLVDAEKKFKNFEKPFDFPNRLRPYSKFYSFEEQDGNYYEKVLQQLDEHTAFLPMRESNKNQHNKEISAIDRYANSGKLLDSHPENNPYSIPSNEANDMMNPHYKVSKWDRLLEQNAQKDEYEEIFRNNRGKLSEIEKMEKHEDEIAKLDYALYNLTHKPGKRWARQTEDNPYIQGGNYAQELININDRYVADDYDGNFV